MKRLAMQNRFTVHKSQKRNGTTSRCWAFNRLVYGITSLAFGAALISVQAKPALAGWQLWRYETSGSNTGAPASPPNSTPPFPASALPDSEGAFSIGAAGVPGSIPGQQARASTSGTVVAVFKWIPVNGEPATPDTAILSILLDSLAQARAYGNSSGAFQADVSNGLQQSDPISETATSTQLLRLQSGRLLLPPYIAPWGQTEIRVQVSPGATAAHTPPPNMSGSAFSNIRVKATLSPIRVSSPDPLGNPQMGQNEYVMTGGGQPFVIPCTVTIDNVDANVLETYRANSNWSLTRALPGQLSPVAPGSSLGSSSGSIFPQFNSDAGGGLTQGLGFSTLNGLPASNSDFGARKAKHYINGINAYSDIEVFYAAAATTHPSGGPPGYEPSGNTNYTNHSTSAATPNWLYYYNQAYPSSVPIEYVNSNLGGYYVDGEDHIHVCNQAHGVYNTELFEKRNPYQGQPNSNHGAYLDFVGTVKTYGIDTYARVVAHEIKHKWIYHTFHNSIQAAQGMNNGVPDTAYDSNGRPVAQDPDADPDFDKLPTWYEQSQGLNPVDADSAQWIPDEGGPIYSNNQGDNEVVARIAQKGVLGPREADWADDGLNKGTMPGLYDERVKVTWAQPEFAYQSPGGPY